MGACASFEWSDKSSDTKVEQEALHGACETSN